MLFEICRRDKKKSNKSSWKKIDNYGGKSKYAKYFSRYNYCKERKNFLVIPKIKCDDCNNFNNSALETNNSTSTHHYYRNSFKPKIKLYTRNNSFSGKTKPKISVNTSQGVGYRHLLCPSGICCCGGHGKSWLENGIDSSHIINGIDKRDIIKCNARQRVSLLGRPLPADSLESRDRPLSSLGGGTPCGSAICCCPCTVRENRYRKLQTIVYNFLERPRGWKQLSYHIILFVAVFICLVLSVFATVPAYEETTGEILFYMEVVMVSWFIIEHIARIWSAGCRSRYMHLFGRLRFATRPFTLLDFVVILASLIVLFLGRGGQVFAASALRGLRFFQILRMVRMDRRGGTWKLLGSVVWAHRQELITTLYIGFLGLIFSSFLVYLAEKNANPLKFGTYADALWWGVITLCTVGYGDVVPVTWTGKVIASICALMGISFFALPAGILGSGFALKVQQQQRQKHLNRRRVPAALLIQSLWRCYAADEKSSSVATWKIYVHPSFLNQSYPTSGTLPICSNQSIFKYNNSFVNRFSSRKYRSGATTYSTRSAENVGIIGSSPKITKGLELPHSAPSTNLTNSGDRFKKSNESIESANADENSPVLLQLDDVQKIAMRCIRKMKYLVARRKFKEALKPYDVKDVLEQYAAGHIDLLSRVKNLQQRFDSILGKQGTKNKDLYISNYSLASRIVNIERQVDDIEHKLDLLLDLSLKNPEGGHFRQLTRRK